MVPSFCWASVLNARVRCGNILRSRHRDRHNDRELAKWTRSQAVSSRTSSQLLPASVIGQHIERLRLYCLPVKLAINTKRQRNGYLARPRRFAFSAPKASLFAASSPQCGIATPRPCAASFPTRSDWLECCRRAPRYAGGKPRARCGRGGTVCAHRSQPLRYRQHATISDNPPHVGYTYRMWRRTLSPML